MNNIKMLILISIVSLFITGCCCCSDIKDYKPSPPISPTQKEGKIKELFKKADNFSDSSNYEDEKQCYDEILEIDPNNYDALVKKGYCLSMLDKLNNEEPLKCFDKAISIDSRRQDAYNYKESLLMREKMDILKYAGWNTGDTDISSNGNIKVALSVLSRIDYNDLSKLRTIASWGEVEKATFQYIGKPFYISGEVLSISDYPAGSDESNGLADGEACSEMQINVPDCTMGVNYILIGSSGNVTAGTTVNCCGILIGKYDSTNSFGGNITVLVFVGKCDFK